MIGKSGWFRLHRYAGLVAAAFLFVQALTGLTLLFGPQMAQLLDPAGQVSGPGSVDAPAPALLAAAEAAAPGFHVSRLVYPQRADATYLVHLADASGALHYASLDRHSAAVLREGGMARFPVVAALNIHNQWLSGTPGTVLVTLTGLVLLFLAGSGLYYWWPKRGPLRKTLAVRWSMAPRLVLRQLHRTAGVSVSVLLILMALTGLLMSIPMVIGGSSNPAVAAAGVGRQIDGAVRLARARFPRHDLRDVRVQGPSRLAVFLFAPERNSMAVHRVIVDQLADGSGQRIGSVRMAAEDRALWVIALPLHNGKALGLAGRLVILLVGLSLAALAVTGPLMWWQARRRRPKAPPVRPARNGA